MQTGLKELGWVQDEGGRWNYSEEAAFAAHMLNQQKKRKTKKTPREDARKKLIKKWEDHFMQTTREQRVEDLMGRIIKAVAVSGKETIRLYAHKRILFEASTQLQDLISKGKVQDVNIHKPLPDAARIAQLQRLVVYPQGWKNPYRPKKICFFAKDKIQQVKEKAERARKQGDYSRVYSRKEWIKDALRFDHTQYLYRLDVNFKKKACDFIVEVWDPSEYLKYISVAYSPAELLDALGYIADPDDRTTIRKTEIRKSGALGNKGSARSTAKEQRDTYEELRKKYPPEKYSKAWLIRMKMQKCHPRKRGWGIRTLKKNLRGLE